MLEDKADPLEASSSEPSVAVKSAVPASREAQHPASKPNFPPPAPRPTQSGTCGILFDFNLGARVLLPQHQNWRVAIRDLDTGNVLFASRNQGAFVASAKRYFIRFRIEVWKDDERVLLHDYSAEGRDVLIQFPGATLGDSLGWFPYALKFQQQHRCKLTCAMSELIIPLFRRAYPDITFVTHEQIDPARYYASYCLGLFFDDAEHVWQPVDFRHVGLHRTAGHILGVDPSEARARIMLPDESRPIAEPYVCIAVQASTQCKKWNNPFGWQEVISYLKASGYRVICIDREYTHGQGTVWTHIPHGSEDETGSRPLTERARWLRHAAFFVGLSSGLSWLAWLAGTPVVLISGFTLADTEFATPYRVINYHTCTGCWNDVRQRFDHNDFMWCPRHAGTPRQFECTRLITSEQVKLAIRRIPGFKQNAYSPAQINA